MTPIRSHPTKFVDWAAGTDGQMSPRDDMWQQLEPFRNKINQYDTAADCLKFCLQCPPSKKVHFTGRRLTKKKMKCQQCSKLFFFVGLEKYFVQQSRYTADLLTISFLENWIWLVMACDLLNLSKRIAISKYHRQLYISKLFPTQFSKLFRRRH